MYIHRKRDALDNSEEDWSIKSRKYSEPVAKTINYRDGKHGDYYS